jgi:hypothetical protein
MDTGKQALTKPQKKVGVPQKKWRREEDKGGEPVVPRRRTCAAELAPLDQRKVGIARSVWQLGSNRPSVSWSPGHFQPKLNYGIVPNHD